MIENRIAELKAQRAELDSQLVELERSLSERSSACQRLADSIHEMPEQHRADLERLLAEFGFFPQGPRTAGQPDGA